MNHRWMLIVAALLIVAACVLVIACENGGGDDDDDDNDDNDDDDEFVILSVQPDNGPVEGGTNVAIFGRGFEEGATLFFGANEATNVEFVSATELAGTTPAATDEQPGLVTVKVVNPDEKYTELENGFRYGEPGVAIDWCVLKWPEATSTTPGTPTENIYGHVYVEGCTETPGSACGSVTGQVGHGPEGADPSVDSELFTWVDAAYNTDFAPEEGSEDINNDEYQAQITEDEAGVYRYAYRFSGDGGGTWTYCDLGAGSEDGFAPSSMGTLTVAARTIGWCNLQYPAETTTPPGTATDNINGLVYYEGCTDGANYCGGLTAQVGHGPQGTNPSTAPGDYTWTTASYNGDHVDDNNDEYQSQIVENDEGDYNFAYRFSADAGATWIYCDLDSSDNGVSTDQLGLLHVAEESIPIGWCNIQWPESTATTVGTPTENIYGRVYVEGYTGGGSASGQITAKLGWGPQGTDPATNPSAYTWLDVAFNTSVGNDDEYMAAITPGAAGTFNYVYRFSTNGGASWTYCDFGDGIANGYSVDDLGTLTVTSDK